MQIKEYQKGEKINVATRINEPIRSINNNLPIIGGPGINVKCGSGGTTISIAQNARTKTFTTLGNVTNAGPNNEPDYTDYRYWVQIYQNNNQYDSSLNNQSTSLLNLQNETDTSIFPSIVTAYYINDYSINGRTLSFGTNVILNWLNIDSNQDGNTTNLNRWYITPLTENSFWAKITASTRSGSNYQWNYSWQQQTLVSPGGYGNWTNGNLTGINNGYNSIENMNGNSGTFGNGINSANLPSGFSLQPCPVNCLIRMYPVIAGNTSTFWFSYENGIDGNCTS